jgi:hypothetical protein
MPTAQQTANEYIDLLSIWERNVKPELQDLTTPASFEWRAIYFTNIFDRFCHFIVAEMPNRGLSSLFFPLSSSNTSADRQKQFKEYVENYLPAEPEDFRLQQFNFARKFLGRSFNYPTPPFDPDDPSEDEVRQFFLHIHAVSFGMYASQRKESVNSTTFKDLVDVLRNFDNRRKSIHVRLRDSLTDRPKGVRIFSLGPACMAEVPGWLLTGQKSEYPIVNGKFVATLEHLGLYNATDTSFPGS